MIQKYFTAGLIALTILLAVGIATTVMASSGVGPLKDMFGLGWGAMTEEQKAEKQVQMDAVKAALDAGDYNAWVAAVKAIDENSPLLSRVNSDNFTEYIKNYQDREAYRQERQTRMEAVKAALDAGDYNAWVTAEKAMNENSQLLAKITADNFTKYAEAHKLISQADGIFDELGVARGAKDGFGKGREGRHGGMTGKGQNGMFGGMLENGPMN